MAVNDKSMPVMPDAPLQSEEQTQLIGTLSVNVLFSEDVMAFEIANNSDTATIYLSISGVAATVATGIPIYAKGYYAAEKKVLQANGISLISDTGNTDVRIVGHYDFESELV